MFETDDEDVVDIVLTEAKMEYGKKLIDVYCYEDAHDEDFPRKYTLNTEEICEAVCGD